MTSEKGPAPLRAEGEGSDRRLDLPLARLRGLSAGLRGVLESRSIVRCRELLEAAGPAEARARLAREGGIEPGRLLALVRRADMARIDGLGVVFGLMLEELGVAGPAALAGADPAALHRGLHALNGRERIARRAPTRDEVESWVRRARELPPLVEERPSAA